MTTALSSILRRGTAFLTPSATSDSLTRTHGTFTTASEGRLFLKVDPDVDGEDCEHDCESCTIKYPSKFSIDEDAKLYGQVKGWATHMLVATGKTDWVRDVEDEKGSVMEAVRECGIKPSNGRLMLSASNMPPPSSYYHDHPAGGQPTTVLLLPSFLMIDNVTPSSVPDLIYQYIDTAPTTTTPIIPPATAEISSGDSPHPDKQTPTNGSLLSNGGSIPPSTVTRPSTPPPIVVPTTISQTADAIPTLNPLSTALTARPSPHAYLILLCSQKTRDARCGQSAPLLRREFERHLRPLGLYRDMHDERPGGVGIYFISHVGGHKFSANVMIYRRSVGRGDGEGKLDEMGDGGQCIWLARVRPEDCEGIIKYTVLKGKVVKPERQLRGGFDREKALVSW